MAKPSIEKYKSAFHHNPEAMSITTVPEGRVVDVNDAFLEVFERSLPEVMGKTSLEIEFWAEPSDREGFISTLLRDGRVREVECRFLTGAGEARDFGVSGRLVDLDGSHHMVATYRDITDRKLVKAALLESEDRFRRIVESSPMGIHLYDLEPGDRLVFRGANRAANSILGVDCAQFVGKTIEEAFPPLEETDVPEKYRKAAALGESSRWEQVDYEHGVIRGAFEVYAFQTKPRSMACLFLDVTERKQAAEVKRETEERLQFMADATFEGIVVTDRGRILDANRAFQDVLGYRPEELVGRDVIDFVAPQDRPLVMEKIRSGFEEVYEHRALRADGSLIDVEVRGHSIKYKGSTARVTAVRDINERKKAERELVQSEKRYRTLFETMMQGVVYQDKDGQVVSANPAAAHILGLSMDQL